MFHHTPMRFSHVLLSLVMFLAITAAPAFAGLDSLDLTFGSGGKATGIFPDKAHELIEELLVQPDGKILAAGWVDYKPGSDFVLLRYNPDGSLDTGFGNQGVMLTDFNFYDYAHALLLLPNGKILVVGETAGLESIDLTLARYLPDGQLDPVFGQNGKVVVDLAGEADSGVDLARTPDGKIYIAAKSGISEVTYLLARFHPDGSLDTGFGDSGSMQIGTGYHNGEGRILEVTPRVVVQADGKIIYSALADGHLSVTRLLSTGVKDASFGQNGTAMVEGKFYPNDLALAPDGKVVVFSSDGSIARFTSAGGLDTTFNQDGIIWQPIDNPEFSYTHASKAAITFDNQLAVVSIEEWTYKNPNRYLSVTTYQPDGSIARSFSDLSCYSPDCAADLSSTFIAAQADGKVLVGADAILTCYTLLGQRDPAFGANGRTENIIKRSSALIQSAALQADGKIVVLRHPGLALSRYLPNGALDPSFGTDGHVGTVHNAVAVIVQPDQKILVAGTYSYPYFLPYNCIEIERYLPDGSRDPGFSLNLPDNCQIGNLFYAEDITLQPDGKIILAGDREYGSGIWRFHSNGELDTVIMNSAHFPTSQIGSVVQVAVQPDGKIILLTLGPDVVRLYPDGSLDTSFDEDGIVRIDFPGIEETVAGLRIQPDGAILVAGATTNPNSGVDFALARLLPDGSLDPTFGQAGSTTVDFYEAEDRLSAIELQTDQKIVLVGTVAHKNGTRDFALVRLNPDGSLDQSLGDGGRLTTDFYGGDDQVFASVLQPDGKLVAAGRAQNGSLYEYALARYNLGPDTSLTLETGQTGTTPDTGASLTLNSPGPCTFSVTRLPAPIFGDPLQFGALPFRWYLASTCESFDLDMTFPYTDDDLSSGNSVIEERLGLYQSQFGMVWVLTPGALDTETNSVTLHSVAGPGYYGLISPGEPDTWIYLPLIR